MKVFVSSCVAPRTSYWEQQLRRFAALSTKYDTDFVETPEEAEVVLIVDIYPGDYFRGLRQNDTWRKYPTKSFALYEGDNPPKILRGLFSSASKRGLFGSRIQSMAYPIHRSVYSNKAPDPGRRFSMEPELLYSFAGRASHRIRAKIMALEEREDVVIRDTSEYKHFESSRVGAQADFRDAYWDLALRSKYALCPRGAGVGSIRLFEMMEIGVAPVVISDDWKPPAGPDWNEFAIFVPEKRVSRIYEVIKSHSCEWRERGENARKAFQDFFAEDSYWDFLEDSIRLMQSRQRVPESVFSLVLPLWFLGLRGNQFRRVTVLRGKAWLRRLLT